MPIKREDMGSTDSMDLTEDTNHGKIYQFLRERDPWAYTRGEIHNQLDIPKGSVGPSLTRLKKEGLVKHQGNHWVIHEDEVEENTENELEPAMDVGDNNTELDVSTKDLHQRGGGKEDRWDSDNY